MKELLNYHEALLDRLNRDYRLAAEFWSSEAVHEVRVDIKRLRAFLSFAGSLNSGDKYLATQDKLEKLFKRAGKLRRFQLQLELTRRYRDELGLHLDTYLNFLKQNELRERKRFREFCADFNLHFLNRNKQRFTKGVASLTTDEVVHRLKAHCEMLLERLKGTIITSDSLPDEYHAVRILAKETRYSLETLRKCSTPSAAYEELDRQLLGLHQALGAWHDFDLATSELAHYVNRAESDIVASPESLSKFASALSTERDLQLELFRARWVDFSVRMGNSSRQYAAKDSG